MNPDSKQDEASREQGSAPSSAFTNPINIALFVFILDQATKIAALRTIKGSIEVIPGFFNLVLVWNKGAAWGIFSKYPIILTLIAAVALVLIAFYFKRLSSGKLGAEIALSLLAGGIAGNLFDRITRGAVVDFLDFYIGKYHWPAFNVADSAITVSVVILVILSFRDEKEK